MLHSEKRLTGLFFVARHSILGQGLLIVEVSRSHSNTPHSVGLPCTSHQPVAETSSWRHTTLTRDILPYPRWDSNP